MDSEQFFYLDEELDVSEVRELQSDELRCVEHYVEVTRHLQEIQQLYQIVLFNLSIMRSNYTWMNNGDIHYKGVPAEGEEHFIAVNSMIINLIGSARTLTESMNCYMAENYESNDTDAQGFLDFTHSIYDGCFAYRFLIRLRDFSQHGHPPVSQSSANYVFDLRQIIGMPHFTHNKQIKEQLSTIVTEIIGGFHGYPTLGVTMTVAEFTVGLWKIYDYFLTCVEAHLQKSFTQAQAILDRYPENIKFKSDMIPGLFIYSIEDGNANVITVGEDTMKMLEKFQMEAKETLTTFQKDWDELKKGTVLIKKDGETSDFSPL